jgi:CRP/FNR family transcriptional regulator, cyclic AMP receptor protein
MVVACECGQPNAAIGLTHEHTEEAGDARASASAGGGQLAIDSFERILSDHPFFQGLDTAHLATLVGCASNVTFDAGRILFRSGEPAQRFFIVREGRVSVEIHAPGRGPVTIETVTGGDVLGWSWLFTPYQWHFDARATTFVRALALDGACLREKCDRDPALGYQMMRRFASVMVARLEATQVQLLGLYGSRS